MLAWGRRGSGLGEAAARPGDSSRRACGVVCLRGSVSTCIQNCLSTWKPFWGPDGSGPEPLLYILLGLTKHLMRQAKQLHILIRAFTDRIYLRQPNCPKRNIQCDCNSNFNLSTRSVYKLSAYLGRKVVPTTKIALIINR